MGCISTLLQILAKVFGPAHVNKEVQTFITYSEEANWKYGAVVVQPNGWTDYLSNNPYVSQPSQSSCAVAPSATP